MTKVSNSEGTRIARFSTIDRLRRPLGGCRVAVQRARIVIEQSVYYGALLREMHRDAWRNRIRAQCVFRAIRKYSELFGTNR